MRCFFFLRSSESDLDALGGECVVNGVHNVTFLNLSGHTEPCINPTGFQQVEAFFYLPVHITCEIVGRKKAYCVHVLTNFRSISTATSTSGD